MSSNVVGVIVEVFADVVCSWAYIGKRHLEMAVEIARQEAATGLPAEPVEVVWRPFLIDPMAPVPATPLEQELRDPMVDAALQQCAPGISPAQNRARARDLAAAVGLGPWQPRWRASSWGAHRLLTSAVDERGPAVQNRVAERLLHDHFVAGGNISDPAVLAALAAEHDLTLKRLPAGYLQGGAAVAASPLERATREQLLRGKALGVRSSPTFVVAGRAVAGARPPQQLAQLLTSDPGDGPGLPEEVERLRLAESLLQQNDPLGALYLLEPLQQDHEGDRNLDELTARALYASAQLQPARVLLERLVHERPDEEYSRLLLGRTLRRLGHGHDAEGHLHLAEAMRPRAHYQPESR